MTSRWGRPAPVRIATLVTSLALSLVGGGTGAAASPTGPPVAATTAVAADPAATAKIEPALRDAFDAGNAGRSSAENATPVTEPYVIEFSRRADLQAASRIDDWAERGAAVAVALRNTAASSQAGVIADLRSSGASFVPFWVNNTVHVEQGTLRAALVAAADDGVLSIRLPDSVELEQPTETTVRQPLAVGGVEWGVADIKADQVWDQLSVRGEGVVVANIDSGVQFDHPALAGSYRGANGDGTVDHNYNWFDPSEICGYPSLEPCDNVGHGTHTMGTMVGDGGDGNRIGVAPGARWIAAKGCEFNGCSEFGLTASAQWILEPTDLAGENPDPARRPNIVNNSWGGPGGDDWYGQFIDAWIAAGIFPVFSNGNEGPQCSTTGAPGEYPGAYSVGNYAADGLIDASSSRGPGTAGNTKPDISAPGTQVRSSVPGGAYALYTGTSMAAPHLAATVALMWSAAPALVGDIEATRRLLDDTGRDQADAQCGGAPDNNNVYGEGKLDALAAVTSAPRGETGVLQGTITDTTGQPVPDAVVALSGGTDRTVVTGADGHYSITLTAGGYDLTVTKYGYLGASADNLDVPASTTTTRDLRLEPAETVQLSGSVHDGSGQGWPLHAKVSIQGTPVSGFTDPATGRYSLSVAGGSEYQVDVAATYPGYQATTRSVPVATDTELSVNIPVDPDTCTAAGYARSGGLQEHFDAAEKPADWSVTDAAGNGQAWAFDDPDSRGNLTGGTDGFAVIDSDHFGQSGSQDTTLTSPVADLTGSAAPVLEFATDLKHNWSERAQVDLSTDGGDTWATVWSAADNVRGPDTVRVPVPQAAHQAAVQVRWHYLRAGGDWWWQIDDVFLGQPVCSAVAGGLVIGTVTDGLLDEPLNGVTVATGTAGESAVSAATPDDDALDDGFYSLFVAGAGEHRVQATARHYEPVSQPISVADGAVTVQDIALAAGRLKASNHQITTTVERGSRGSAVLSITNPGNASATYVLEELEGDAVPIDNSGAVATVAGTGSAADVPVRRVPAEIRPSPDGGGSPGGGGPGEPANVPGRSTSGPVDPGHSESVDPTAGVDASSWQDLTPYPTKVKDSAAGYLDGILYSFGGSVGDGSPLTASYSYDETTSSWSPIASMPAGRQKPAGAFLHGKFVVTGGWGADQQPIASTSIYDPQTDSWSGAADLPVPVAAPGTAVLDGLLYVVGGCATVECGSTGVQRYDPVADRWTRLADFPQNTAWESCGGIGGKVYCAGGIGPDTDSLSTYVYDPRTDAWTQVADMPVDLWAGAYAVSGGRLLIAGGAADRSSVITNEAIAYDPADDSWSALPNSTYSLYRSAGACGLSKVGGSDGTFRGDLAAERLPGNIDCASAVDVPWLRTSDSNRTVKARGTHNIRLILDARSIEETGSHTATLRLSGDVLGEPVFVTVTMVVE